MANVKNLATAEDKFKQLSITHDMTKKERLQNREKLAEAKNKNDVLIGENNQSVKYKYLFFKGPPGDRKVVQIKKRSKTPQNNVNSQVLTETNVNKVMDFNGLQCFYTNADSLPNKLGELMTRIQDEKIVMK